MASNVSIPEPSPCPILTTGDGSRAVGPQNRSVDCVDPQKRACAVMSASNWSIIAGVTVGRHCAMAAR